MNSIIFKLSIILVAFSYQCECSCLLKSETCVYYFGVSFNSNQTNFVELNGKDNLFVADYYACCQQCYSSPPCAGLSFNQQTGQCVLYSVNDLTETSVINSFLSDPLSTTIFGATNVN